MTQYTNVVLGCTVLAYVDVSWKLVLGEPVNRMQSWSDEQVVQIDQKPCPVPGDFGVAGVLMGTDWVLHTAELSSQC